VAGEMAIAGAARAGFGGLTRAEEFGVKSYVTLPATATAVWLCDQIVRQPMSQPVED
jgi:hypothetical protein